ncbi:hypothetical protein HPO96_18490 [Kribbella sandramycini]|uniref:Exonuclease VII small subunit n=1 Tax=Kribbella sandramycini TaxID=60450 RepID=A0A7Y4L0T3_9ACTN|nr:hypothetical protein [Kribbella sandramycini]MBB6564534.1 exonuclease VII small subunit [Kribbella sandramycini]NOL42238.1 hypothetical protein [Kribbella sandramycini]
MSVQEVKAAITKANAESSAGAATLSRSSAKLDEALTMLNRAAEGTGHELIGQAQTALRAAKASIEEARKAIARSQESASTYARSI